MSSKRMQITFPPLDLKFILSPLRATGQILYNVHPFSNSSRVSVKINEGKSYVGKGTTGYCTHCQIHGGANNQGSAGERRYTSSFKLRERWSDLWDYS